VTTARSSSLATRRSTASFIDTRDRYGFSRFDPLEGQSDARPQPTAMYLMMQDIKAAEAGH
jgi:hypothetical protein